MPFAPFIFLICLVAGIAYLIYVKRKERELIEQVTPITRGEWSERRVVLKLLKAGINPQSHISRLIHSEAERHLYTSRCSRCNQGGLNRF